VNTAAAAQVTVTFVLAKRSCARKPAMPKAAANSAAVTRCSEAEPSVADGPMPGIAPPGSTSMSTLRRTAHSPNTMKTNADAAAITPVAAGARQATTRLPAVSRPKPIIAVSACALLSTISIAPNR
jgi:hypothetical protein